MDPITRRLTLGADYPEASVTYQGTYTNGSSGTGITYTAAPLGTATNDRVILVGSAARSGSINTCTIGGVSATRLINYQPTSEGIGIFALRVPSGTSADISVTFNASTTRASIHVWSAYNVLLPYQLLSSAVGVSTRPVTLDSYVIRGSIGVCVTYNNDSASYTYTGLTENFDSYVNGGTFSCASQAFSATENPRAMSCLTSDTSPAYATTVLAVIR